MRSASVHARVEPTVKVAAEKILAEIGLTSSDAVNLFYRQIVKRGGLPFRLSGGPNLIDLDTVAPEELEKALQEAEAQIERGDTVTLEEFEKELLNRRHERIRGNTNKKRAM